MARSEDTHIPLINSIEAESSSATKKTDSLEVVILPSKTAITMDSNVFNNEKRHPHYLKKQTTIDRTSLSNISRRLAMRKKLHNRITFVTDIMCFLGILGIILMIIENEITFSRINTDDTILTWSIKLIITFSTVILIGLIMHYHYLEVSLYAVNNAIEDSRVTITTKRIFLIVFEIAVCSIHPIPRSFPRYLNASLIEKSSNSSTPPSYSLSYMDTDVALGLPMFARLYLIFRFMMFHSHLFLDASSRSIGYLNKISIDYFFLIKTYLEKDPIRTLTILCICLFLIGSWCLRACHCSPASEQASMLNSMWLFVVTFTTVGYGDFTPSTYCGRSVSAITSLVGVFSTALVIAVLAQRLLMNRREKYVHNFVLNIQLTKEYKLQAANVMKFAFKVWYMRHKKGSVSSFQHLQVKRQLFEAIHLFHEVKQKQKKLIDCCVDHVDLLAIQRNTSAQTYEATEQLKTMKVKIDNIEEKLLEMNINMNNTIDNIERKLNMLLDKFSK
ncbi:unnamed protein product [Rotaria sp. Silwood1]|nr:unnamed protein product [Rotaria sp. Silwood1]